MVIDNRRLYYYSCPNCEWRILNNQIRDISGYEDKIHFCERCGSKLDKINLNDSNNTSESNSETNLNSIEYPVEIIAKDPDFQIRFIDNLTLVLARMIYFNIRYLEKTLDKKFENIELDLQLLNLLSGALMPILQNDIEEQFLDRLIEITLADFYSNLTKIHNKVKSYPIFRQRFIIYLRWLTKKVFVLVSELWNEGSIDKFDATIFKDLNNYDFNKIQIKFDSDEIENNGTNEEVFSNFKDANGISEKEIEFLKKYKIDTTKLRSRWAWIEGNNDILENYFTEIIIPYFDHVPSSSELKNNGYSRLVKYIYSIYPNYKQFVTKVVNEEYKPYYRKISYGTINKIKKITGLHVFSFINHNKSRLPLTISQIIEENKLGITPNTFKNHAIEYLEQEFGEGIGKILFFEMWGSTKISPSKIKKIRALVQKTISDYEENGNLPPSLYSLSNRLKISWRTFGRHAKAYLREKYPETKAKLFYRTFWENPEIETLSKKKINLIYKLTNKELRSYQKSKKLYDPTPISELSFIEDLQIKPDTFRKYAKSYLISKFGKENGIKIYEEMWPGSGQKATRRVIKNIKEKVNLELERYFSSKEFRITPLSFLCSLPEIKVSEATFGKYAKKYLYERFGDYGDILYSELWSSDLLSLRTNSGRLFHSLISFILTSFFINKGVYYFSEVQIYSGTKKVDGLILIENCEFFSELNSIFKSVLKVDSLSKYKAIIFDYTSAISDKNVIKKIKKYQDSEILLIIVGYRWYFNKNTRTLPEDKGILFPGNIRIISLDLFYSIFDLSENLTSKIKKYESFFTRFDLTSLKEAKLDEKIDILGNSSLKTYLKTKLLIKENINEFFNLGLREYPIKEFLTPIEIKKIENLKPHKIAIVDIETTSFAKNFALIVEIGIIELDISTGEKSILFNALIYENGIENYDDKGAFSISNLDISEVKKAKSLESYRETLQLIFDNYRITSYNTAFDLAILELRGFKFPKKMTDMMKFIKRILPKGKYNFHFAYKHFYNLKDNTEGKFLTNNNYEEQHRALDDAIHEAELLFLLINKFKFPTSYQDDLNIDKGS